MELFLKKDSLQLFWIVMTPCRSHWWQYWCSWYRRHSLNGKHPRQTWPFNLNTHSSNPSEIMISLTRCFQKEKPLKWQISQKQIFSTISLKEVQNKVQEHRNKKGCFHPSSCNCFIDPTHICTGSYIFNSWLCRWSLVYKNETQYVVELMG